MNVLTLAALIPILPLFAAGIAALMKREQRVAASAIAIGALSVSLLLSVIVFATAIAPHPEIAMGAGGWRIYKTYRG